MRYENIQSCAVLVQERTKCGGARENSECSLCSVHRGEKSTIKLKLAGNSFYILDCSLKQKPVRFRSRVARSTVLPRTNLFSSLVLCQSISSTIKTLVFQENCRSEPLGVEQRSSAPSKGVSIKQRDTFNAGFRFDYPKSALCRPVLRSVFTTFTSNWIDFKLYTFQIKFESLHGKLDNFEIKLEV